MDADAGEERVEVAGDADGHHGDDGDVFQQQVPADEPADHLAERHVAVGVGRAGPRDHAGELRVGQRRGRGCQARNQEGEQHGRPDAGFGLAAVGHEARQREDADADNAADADGRQLPQAQALEQPAVFVFVLDVVDGLASA